MKKLNRKHLRKLISESVKNVLRESASSNEIRALQAELGKVYDRMEDHIQNDHGGDENQAYAHGYAGYFQEEISKLESKISKLQSELPATVQMELPMPPPSLSDEEKRIKDEEKRVADMEAFDRFLGFDPSGGYLSKD